MDELGHNYLFVNAETELACSTGATSDLGLIEPVVDGAARAGDRLRVEASRSGRRSGRQDARPDKAHDGSPGSPAQPPGGAVRDTRRGSVGGPLDDVPQRATSGGTAPAAGFLLGIGRSSVTLVDR
jgi:hypothetical protein